MHYLHQPLHNFVQNKYIKDKGNSCAKFSAKYPSNINTPLLWMEPLIFTSLSMFTIPLLPQAVATVILDGFPKVCSPVLNTDKPFITPTCFPSISINVFSFLYDSSIFSSILSMLILLCLYVFFLYILNHPFWHIDFLHLSYPSTY